MKLETMKDHFGSSLNHKTQLGLVDVLNYVDMIGGYNRFDSKKVRSMLIGIDELMPNPFYQPKNCNNWMRDYRISIGREGSPVIYYEMYQYKKIKSYPQTLREIFETVCNGSTRIERIKDQAERVGLCDEFFYEIKDYESYSAGQSLDIRIWWD